AAWTTRLSLHDAVPSSRRGRAVARADGLGGGPARDARIRRLSRRDPLSPDPDALRGVVAPRESLVLLPRRGHTGAVVALVDTRVLAGTRVARRLPCGRRAHLAAAVVGRARAAGLHAELRAARRLPAA